MVTTSAVQLWLPGGGLVHVHATVDPSCTIEAAAVVQDGARLGKKCRIGSGSIVGPQVSIGNNSTLDHQVATPLWGDDRRRHHILHPLLLCAADSLSGQESGFVFNCEQGQMLLSSFPGFLDCDGYLNVASCPAP